MATYDLSKTVPTLYYYRIAPGDTNIIAVLVYDVNVELSGADVGRCPNAGDQIQAISQDLPPYGFVGYNWVDTSKGAETGVATFHLNNLVFELSPIGDAFHLYIPKQDSLDDYIATLDKPDKSPTQGYSDLKSVVFGVMRGANNTQALVYARTVDFFTRTATIKLPSPNTMGAGFASSFYFSAGGTSLPRNSKNDACAKELMSKAYEPNPDNPYQGGDEPPEDVTGTFSYTSDDNPIPELPTTSVTDSGLVTLYAPTESQLQALASYLWSDAFSLDSFKKLFNNPMDCILGLTMVPVNLPHGAAREITVGNIVSTVSCDVCSSQYVSVDCGTFKFSSSRFTGSFLDYSPYLKCYLYLPFIGTNEIDIDEWQNSTMRVVYHVDILTGAMFCFVTRDGKLVTTYSGQCAENVPLSSNDFSTTIGSILGVASTAVGAIATVATAGAAAPAAAAAKTAGTVAGAGLSTAVNVGHSKPSIRHGGGVGGGAGIMGKKYPYLVFIAPHMASPNDQNKYVGFPSNKIVQLSSCSGYTEVQAINLSIKAENITDKELCTPSATDAEMDLIKSLLESGVIF